MLHTPLRSRKFCAHRRTLFIAPAGAEGPAPGEGERGGGAVGDMVFMLHDGAKSAQHASQLRSWMSVPAAGRVCHRVPATRSADTS